MEQIIFFDTKTMLGILFLCNLCLSALVLAFQSTAVTDWEHSYVRRATVIRMLFTISYSMFYLRDNIPDFFSVNVGNTLFFIAFYFETSLMLSMINRDGPKMRLLLKMLLAVSLVAFNVVELIKPEGNVRVLVASLIVFAFHVIPALFYTFTPHISQFRRAVGIIYDFLVLALVPRAMIAATNPDMWVHSNALAQQAFYLSLIMLMIVSTMCQLLFMKEETDRVLQRMAMTDQLTGVSNRHSFLHNAQALIDYCRREGRMVAMIYLDVDYFKEINDRYGHEFGDRVLTKVAQTLSESMRAGDLICRYGGEEFLVMFVAEHEEDARQVAERIRSQQSAIRFSEYPDFSMSVSIGICGRVSTEAELDDIIRCSDKALYLAKNAGRNQVLMYEESFG